MSIDMKDEMENLETQDQPSFNKLVSSEMEES